MSLVVDSLSVCLFVITWQNIDQAGGPETFINFVWPHQGSIVLHT